MKVHLDGHVMVPNLGYKKDTFLELSLVSDFLSNAPITTLPTTTTMVNCCNDKQPSHSIRGSPSVGVG